MECPRVNKHGNRLATLETCGCDCLFRSSLLDILLYYTVDREIFISTFCLVAAEMESLVCDSVVTFSKTEGRFLRQSFWICSFRPSIMFTLAGGGWPLFRHLMCQLPGANLSRVALVIVCHLPFSRSVAVIIWPGVGVDGGGGMGLGDRGYLFSSSYKHNLFLQSVLRKYVLLPSMFVNK